MKKVWWKSLKKLTFRLMIIYLFTFSSFTKCRNNLFLLLQMHHFFEFKVILVFFCLYTIPVLGVEFTFELEDKTKQCFFEEVQQGVQVTLEYQVVTGGKYDVDCSIEDEDSSELYTGKRKSYDAFQWDAKKTGTIKFCFSNEFSTISHKVVYFDLTVGDEEPLFKKMNNDNSELSLMEVACVFIHERLKDVLDHQTHFKLREAQGRRFAQGLGLNVQIWSMAQLIIMVAVMAGQVYVLRSFFTNNHHHLQRTDI